MRIKVGQVWNNSIYAFTITAVKGEIIEYSYEVRTERQRLALLKSGRATGGHGSAYIESSLTSLQFTLVYNPVTLDEWIELL